MPTESLISTVRRGAVQRWTACFIPTTRDAPSDAEMPSHVFLTRAGYIRRLGAGIYDYLPLGWRVLRKIERIVREEMDRAGGAELHFPALIPMELFAETGRDVDYGDLLFQLEDRHGRGAALGPTHEEVVTELMRGALTSYKQFPLTVYQIQTKYRDEARPRAGLLRGREFIMKDAYSFHLSLDGPGGLHETYDRLHQAYIDIFKRCGLDFSVVEAEAGPIGGSASHEFMVNCASGEDTILVCPQGGYAANVEKCEIGRRPWAFDEPAAAETERVHTPNLPGIAVVAESLGVEPMDMLKTVVFEAVDPEEGGTRWVLATVRGDHEVNEGKVRDAAGVPVKLADEQAARAAGFAIGYVSPGAVRTIADCALLIDPDATSGSSWVTGADEKDHHVRHWSWVRQLGELLPSAAPEKQTGGTRVRIADIRNAMAGDPSPRAEGVGLESRRGIEVGHIFKLGRKYSEAMGLTVLDQRQQKQSVIMGCYGIGVSRTMAACVEMSHDDNGIIWPAALAPYHVLITVLMPKQGEALAHAERIAGELSAAGVDVLIDDRDERPGPKFKDADLVGIPVRLTIGPKTLEQGGAEFKRRADPGRGELVPLAEAVPACLDALAR